MSLLRFLLYSPMRRRLRILQARLELLSDRLERMEKHLEESRFLDPATREKLRAALGKTVALQMDASSIRGTLVSVQYHSLEMKNEAGQMITVPVSRITAVMFDD
ncbi:MULTISPECIES: hypothetical protein [Paenibacillus]|uniref:hypothetical protein n=1 Tax=Paenibacillus TaxID=44249 RepID=UPI002FE04E5D